MAEARDGKHHDTRAGEDAGEAKAPAGDAGADSGAGEAAAGPVSPAGTAGAAASGGSAAEDVAGPGPEDTATPGNDGSSQAPSGGASEGSPGNGGAAGAGPAAAERLAELEAECRGLRERLAEAERLAAGRLEQLQRMQADFANYRRRMMQEQARWREQAIGDFVLTLLPVVDNLERALAAGRDGDPLKEGVAMVHRQLLDTLRQVGVEPIEALGQPFDPRLHEAVAREETDRVPDGHVIEVFQRGYLYQGRTLRPALTKVAVGGPAAPAAAADEPAGGGAEGPQEGQPGGVQQEAAPAERAAAGGNADAEEATST